MKGLLPEAYENYAAELFEKMLTPSTTENTSEQDVAEKVFAAATDESDRLRYPAGADSEMFAGLRWTNSEDEYLRRMRAIFAPKLKV